MYGCSPVEQVLTTLNIAVRRTRFQLASYTDGNVPEALYTMPAGVTEDRIRDFQQWFDLQNAGNLAHRRRIWFIPGDDKGVNRLHFTKESLLKDDADEWFARIICFAFRISPKELVKIMNRSTAVESQDSSEEMGVHVMCEWVAETINYIIQRKAGDADIEFTFAQKREADVLKQAQADKIYVDSGVRTRNEVRDELGDDPSQDPQADVLGVTTQQGFLPLDLAQKQVEAEIGRAGSTPNEKRPANSGKAPTPNQSDNAKVFKLAGLIDEHYRSQLAAALTSFFEKALEQVRGVLLDEELNKADDDKTPDLSDLLDSLDEEFDWESLVAPAANVLTGATASGASMAIGQAQVANVKVMASASDAARNYASKRAAEMVGKRWKNGKLVQNPDAQWRIDKTTREELRNIIEAAFAEKLSRSEIVRRIEDAGPFSLSRAQMIAQTEIVRAQSMGALAVWKSAGITKVRWIAGGPNPCEECLTNAAAGSVELGKAFPSGDIAPGAHPRCSCALVPGF